MDRPSVMLVLNHIEFCHNLMLLLFKCSVLSIFSYMKVVESLPSYGIHFYEVKVKGISFVCEFFS